MNMRVNASVSFESDTKPVLTHRETFLSADFASACKTALFRAEKAFSKAARAHHDPLMGRDG
jgi:hypothetical protein